MYIVNVSRSWLYKEQAFHVLRFYVCIFTCMFCIVAGEDLMKERATARACENCFVPGRNHHGSGWWLWFLWIAWWKILWLVAVFWLRYLCRHHLGTFRTFFLGLFLFLRRSRRLWWGRRRWWRRGRAIIRSKIADLQDRQEPIRQFCGWCFRVVLVATRPSTKQALPRFHNTAAVCFFRWIFGSSVFFFSMLSIIRGVITTIFVLSTSSTHSREGIISTLQEPSAERFGAIVMAADATVIAGSIFFVLVTLVLPVVVGKKKILCLLLLTKRLRWSTSDNECSPTCICSLLFLLFLATTTRIIMCMPHAKVALGTWNQTVGTKGKLDAGFPTRWIRTNQILAVLNRRRGYIKMSSFKGVTLVHPPCAVNINR